MVMAYVETHLAEASSFCCVFPLSVPEALIAACCLRQDTGLGGHWNWPACQLLCVSGWSASLSSVSMGWQHKFCPAANGVFQKASFCFFPGQVEEVQQHGCFTRGQFPWLTAGTLIQELVIFQFWHVALHAEIVLKINWNDYFLQSY